MNAKEFLKLHLSQVNPLQTAACIAYRDSSISGDQKDYDKFEELQIKLNDFYTDKNMFAILQEIKKNEVISDPLMKREIEIVYDNFLWSQADKSTIELLIKQQTEIEKKFSTFRAQAGDQSLTDNEVDDILQNSNDSKQLQTVWEAHKKVGALVAEDVRELARLRNKIAQEVGFENYHTMSLTLSEQNLSDIEKLFDELDILTRPAFMEVKNEIDEHLSHVLNITKDQLRPWHYKNKFFQEFPSIYPGLNFDSYFKDQNIETLSKDFFASIGVDVTSIIARSDLYEKPWKNQHAYCIHIDKAGDVRTLCNLKPNHKWMDTMLHELGHAIYDQHIDFNLPSPLVSPAHTFVTEAIAMFFGRLASDAQRIQDMLHISNEEKEKISSVAKKTSRLKQLLFSRRAQVMYRFEKALYNNPEQDLDTLWRDLVENYQGLVRPESRKLPDWASKIHIATSPCYYHNYLLGELLASQISHVLGEKFFGTENIQDQHITWKKEIWAFLKEHVFALWSLYPWNELIKKATGEWLTSKYFAKEFIG